MVDPCDRMADWELQVITTAQHHERVSYCISLAWEKTKIQASKYSFYRLRYHFHIIVKSKNHQLNHHRLGTIWIG